MNNNKIKNECSAHNRALHRVRHKSSYSAEKFLNSSVSNLLINGGSVQDRASLIKKEIVHFKGVSSAPVIIFSNNRLMQTELINLAQSGNIGRLFVCSDEYKNYDVFCGMKNNLISDYFSMLASEKGYRDASELHDYIGAFLNTLRISSEVNLSSIKVFSENSDTAIANMAVSNGNNADSQILLGSSKGGFDFRRLLSMVCSAFDNLTEDRCCTGFNINAVMDKNCVVYISTDSYDYDFLSLYFLQELKQVIGKSFTLVFDDCLLLNNKSLMEFTDVLKQRTNINVVLSTDNIMSLPGEKNLINFSREIVFLKGSAPSSDIQQVLSALGEYSHFEATSTEGTPPKLLFSFLKSENSSPTNYTRPKVLIEEELGNEAVLRGHHSAEILIVKKLIN